MSAARLGNLQFTALAVGLYTNNRGWEHPISGVTSKHSSSVIAMLINGAPAERGRASPPICWIHLTPTW